MSDDRYVEHGTGIELLFVQYITRLGTSFGVGAPLGWRMLKSPVNIHVNSLSTPHSLCSVLLSCLRRQVSKCSNFFPHYSY